MVNLHTAAILVIIDSYLHANSTGNIPELLPFAFQEGRFYDKVTAHWLDLLAL